MLGMINRQAKMATRIQSRLGLLLGAVLLCGLAQLRGKDQSPAAAVPAVRSGAPQHVLVISLTDRKLAVLENGRVLKVYSIAVGAAATPSPTGTMKIANKIIGPTWYHRGKVVPPGKLNPLGNRWMGLDQKGYGIHGTNAPDSIGKAVSHGCFRMGKHDVEELFKLARVGDTVEIHGERDAEVAGIFGHPAEPAPPAAGPVTVASTPGSAAPTVGISPVALAAVAGEASGE